MKSLLSISLLSVLLSFCNTKEKKQEETNATASERIDPATMPSDNEHMEAETTMDGAKTDETAPSPTAEKPAYNGEMPDTSKKQVIEHGSPDKARNDSVKAAKTKGKF